MTTLIRRSALGAIALTLALLFGPSPVYAEQAVAAGAGTHRILTCNILLDLPEHSGTLLDWKTKRRDLCFRVIRQRKPDILCLQEVGAGQQKDFAAAFPEMASFGYVDPYTDTSPRRFQSIKNVIMYSRKRYELASAGTYWLSQTPIIAGTRMPGAGLPRHVTWVRLKDVATDKQFRVLATHWELKQPIRELEAKIILDECRPYAPQFPQILAGDFNSQYNSPEHQLLFRDNWCDTYREVHDRGEPDLTRVDTRDRPKIDFIFYRGDVQPVGADIIRDHEGEIYPSDHYFVWADVEI